ncbi:uncharacterized protein LOC143444354 isoform X2 [Clavelina lepadiformis]|uniref:uncharacterized protein LOC143444354 isoform X2 n=1 Tax=Clavelina lepadiformis TaxID=159417 RepID=UPI0040412958
MFLVCSEQKFNYYLWPVTDLFKAMSFPRAPVKRFNDTEGCAPGVGTYSIRGADKSVGVIKFENCSERFKSTESLNSDTDMERSNTPSKEFAKPSNRPKKKVFNTKFKTQTLQVEKQASSQKSPQTSKQKQDQEKEIRKLLQQCNDRERDLQTCNDEILKLQGKVANLTKEKILLESQVHNGQQTITALEKKNELLVAKNAEVPSSENFETNLKAAQVQLLTCQQKIEKDEIKLTSLTEDLLVEKSKVSALEESNQTLEFYQSKEKHREDVAAEVRRLQNVADKLRLENTRLHKELSTCQMTLSNIRKSFHSTLQAAVNQCLTDCSEKTQYADDAMLKLQERIEIANQKIGGLNSVITNLTNDRNSLKEENSNMREKLDDLTQCNEALSSEKRALCDVMKTKEEEVLTFQQNIDSLNSQLEKVTKEHSSAEKLQTEKLEVLKLENEELKRELETKCVLSEKLTEQLEEISAQVGACHDEKDVLSKENISLQDQLKENETSLESARIDNWALQTQLNEISTDNKVLLERIEQAESDLVCYEEKCSASNDKCATFENKLTSVESAFKEAASRLDEEKEKVERMEHTIKDMETQNSGKLHEFTRRIMDTQKKLNQRDDELKANREEMTSQKKLAEKLQAKLISVETDYEMKEKSLLEHKNELQADLDQVSSELEELKSKASEVDTDELIKELEKWKAMYENLEEKVRPFQSQLDAYSAERNMLLCETNAAQAEMNQLGHKYAELLGHHNHKQKIKHVVKIKDENLTLKQENSKLRNQVINLQKQVIHNRKPRFDKTKAFQHQKENADPN